MTDIVERLNMRPFRYAAETELQAQERRQKEREEGAQEIVNLRAQLEIVRQEYVEMQTRLILDTAEIISAMKLKNKKLPDGFDEETVLKIIARCAPGGVNE